MHEIRCIIFYRVLSESRSISDYNGGIRCEVWGNLVPLASNDETEHVRGITIASERSRKKFA